MKRNATAKDLKLGTPRLWGSRLTGEMREFRSDTVSEAEAALPAGEFSVIGVGPYSKTHRIGMMKQGARFIPVAVSKSDMVSADISLFTDYAAFQRETALRRSVYALLVRIDAQCEGGAAQADRDFLRAMRSRDFLFRKLAAELQKGAVPKELESVLVLFDDGRRRKLLATAAVFGNGLRR